MGALHLPGIRADDKTSLTSGRVLLSFANDNHSDIFQSCYGAMPSQMWSRFRESNPNARSALTSHPI
ncbi:hypothetical protein HOS53_gp211 [Klebsiella phage May]|uniref:Uncharacterized protein n=1 Tax=Klebsiella phage May TaxID=2054272 RepID=A0A2H5BNN7_9CAUD|nr:hypothetical protein HOS53_gp211 [Klebsiella phage May]AUG87949.1 hypothetical protein CPT_May_035 [Klebsiella phage May]